MPHHRPMPDHREREAHQLYDAALTLLAFGGVFDRGACADVAEWLRLERDRGPGYDTDEANEAELHEALISFFENEARGG